MFRTLRKSVRILVADERRDNREMLCDLLETYECTSSATVEEALAGPNEGSFDAVVVGTSADSAQLLELVSRIRMLLPETVVIVVSEKPTLEAAVEVIRAGGFDYLPGPPDHERLTNVVARALDHYNRSASKRRYENFLETIVEQRTTELDRAVQSLENTYRMTLKALTASLEMRDHETHGHSERVVSFSLRLGAELGITGEQLRSLEFGALLHDIGKIGVPDAILRKPSPLDDNEWLRMREHPLHGQKILRDVEFLKGASRVVAEHHERWDGSGYPLGLKGEEIDLNARVFAVADAFDAMTSDRVYRNGRTYEAAAAELLSSSGCQFDPRVVKAFMRVQREEWAEIRRRSLHVLIEPPAKRKVLDGTAPSLFELSSLPTLAS